MKPSQEEQLLQTQVKTKNFSPLPVLSENAVFPALTAQAVLAVDENSGVFLYEKDIDKPLLPASTTKIITALVAINYFSPEEVLTIVSPKVEGQKMDLVQGEEIKFKDLLYGLLVYSANDAAEAIAAAYCAPRSFLGLQSVGAVGGEVGPCGRDVFIAAMNEKAKELSLENTHFENPTGLDEGSHLSTARDLVRVSQVAMTNPLFAKIVGTSEITVTNTDGKIVHKLTNINQLLGEVPGVLGIKTGWTENARENLVTYIEREGQKVIIVVLGSNDRFGETKELINWIFTNYSWQEVSGSSVKN